MGNIFSNAFGSLKEFVFYRRENEHGVRRSISKHPERLDPDQLSLVSDNKHTKTPTQSIPIITNEPIETSTTSVSASPVVAPFQKCSDFYLACRHNKIEKVKKFLQTMSQDEIDQIEPNGSTALHAASYHGHRDIVKLLLERGADRAIFNKYQCLPFDEAPNDEIKELFLRIPTSNRLVMNTGAIEWELIDDDVLEQARENRQIIRTIYNSVSVEKMFEKIEKNYINKGLATISTIENIKHFFKKATQGNDPKWIIKAYTAETDFYNVLNRELAGGAGTYQSERRYIVALLSHHPILDSLPFRGMSYRVMEVNDYDLEKYKLLSIRSADPNLILKTK